MKFSTNDMNEKDKKIAELERQNAILKERLFMAKRDTKIRNRRWDNLIAKIFHDSSLTIKEKKIRSKHDLLWDADKICWRLLAFIIQEYFKTGMESLPENMSEKDFEHRKELMIYACVKKSEYEIGNHAYIEHDDKVEEGIKYLIEYLPKVWI